MAQSDDRAASLPERTVSRFASDVLRVAARRRLTLLALTDDARFARVVAQRRFLLDPGTGALTVRRRWWPWF